MEKWQKWIEELKATAIPTSIEVGEVERVMAKTGQVGRPLQGGMERQKRSGSRREGKETYA